MNFSLDQLLAFVTAVEEGSFKLAAVKLGKHATTVSQQVASLEIDTGLHLFDRQVRKLNLTEQGKDFYQHARPMLVEAGHLANKVQAMTSGEPGELRLALGSTIRDRQLLRCAAEVVKRYPRINLEVLSGDPLQVIQWLDEGRADLGVMTTLFDTYKNVTSVQLFNFELINVASPRWIKTGQPATEAMVRSFPQVVYRYVMESPQMHGHLVSNHHYLADSLDDLLDLVSLGLGWAIVPRFKVEELLEEGELVAFAIGEDRPVNWYAELVYRDNTTLNPAMQCFIDQVKRLPDR